ncbi:MAG: hypothetical protein ABR607_14845 [Pyrinomonadaceae bacterium]
MKSRRRNQPAILACIVMFAVTQVYLGLAFAAPAASSGRITIPQALSGVLTTQGNKPINVNGASATTGATILNGSMIETPDGVTATINIPGHGVITLAAKSRVILNLDQNGNIRVSLLQGCAVVHTQRGTTGEIDNAQGMIGKTDPAKDDLVDACRTKVAGAVAGAGGLSTGGKVAIAAAVVGGGVGLALALRRSNPSQSTP